MPLDNPKGGIGYAAEFQSSALPFVTSSQAPQVTSGVLRIDFPKVTRFLTFFNHDSLNKELRIGFTRNGVVSTGNYYLLDGGSTITLELRVSKVYLAGNASSPPFSMVAGLTTVDARDMPLLSGTLPDGTAGWPGVG